MIVIISLNRAKFPRSPDQRLTYPIEFSGVESMFLRHARTARFAAAYLLLFTASLVLMVPKVNAPETLFDEDHVNK